jgi:hypothetical protein
VAEQVHTTTVFTTCGEPLSGDKLEIVGGTFVTVNTTLPASPVGAPVTVTVYAPLAPVATVKDPETTPTDTVHVGLEKRPLGDEEIKHVVSPEANPEPATATTVPGGPEAGVRVTVGPRRTM